MVARAEAWARARGAARLHLYALEGNTRAIDSTSGKAGNTGTESDRGLGGIEVRGAPLRAAGVTTCRAVCESKVCPRGLHRPARRPVPLAGTRIMTTLRPALRPILAAITCASLAACANPLARGTDLDYRSRPPAATQGATSAPANAEHPDRRGRTPPEPALVHPGHAEPDQSPVSLAGRERAANQRRPRRHCGRRKADPSRRRAPAAAPLARHQHGRRAASASRPRARSW